MHLHRTTLILGLGLLFAEVVATQPLAVRNSDGKKRLEFIDVIPSRPQI